MSQTSIFTSELWRVNWRGPATADNEMGPYHTAYIAAPSLSSAARLAQPVILKTLGESPQDWPNVSFEQYGDVTWESQSCGCPK